MKIEQQLVRDQLAVELVKLLASNIINFGASDVVNASFEIADLTVKRMADDLQKLIDEDKKQTIDDALVKTEQQITKAHDFEERRKGGGINVIETDDLRELLALFRSLHTGL